MRGGTVFVLLLLFSLARMRKVRFFTPMACSRTKIVGSCRVRTRLSINNHEVWRKGRHPLRQGSTSIHSGVELYTGSLTLVLSAWGLESKIR